MFDDTIVAISTPPGEGGIGIVRLSGDRALKIANKVFKKKDGGKASGLKSHTIHYGRIVSGRNGRTIDEVLLTVMRSPKSYTREDIVEINCHGGMQSTKNVLELILSNGARLAQPGEFTKRAFLNGRIDLSQAEAVLDTIRAKTDGALKVALGQLEGGLSGSLKSLIDRMADILAEVEASIDFPDEGLKTKDKKKLILESGRALAGIERMIESYKRGSVMREGVLAIICGKPNVGKSSLMNILLKRDRVIVSPIPGTTRDAVEEMIDIDGLPIRLVDTAGIGASADPLVTSSENKTKGYMDLADVAIIVLDGSKKVDAKDRRIIDLVGDKKKLFVINKSDLGKKITQKDLKPLADGYEWVRVSVKDGTNIDGLEKKISKLVLKGKYDQGESAVVANARHKESLDKSRGYMLSVVSGLKADLPPELIAVDLKDAIFALGAITGVSVSADILDRIFQKFCVGK
jgi:tRNA modification GTPase